MNAMPASQLKFTHTSAQATAIRIYRRMDDVIVVSAPHTGYNQYQTLKQTPSNTPSEPNR